MVLTLTVVLIICAVVCTIMAGMGKAPLWVAVLLLCWIEAIRILPLK